MDDASLTAYAAGRHRLTRSLRCVDRRRLKLPSAHKSRNCLQLSTNALNEVQDRHTQTTLGVARRPAGRVPPACVARQAAAGGVLERASRRRATATSGGHWQLQRPEPSREASKGARNDATMRAIACHMAAILLLVAKSCSALQRCDRQLGRDMLRPLCKLHADCCSPAECSMTPRRRRNAGCQRRKRKRRRQRSRRRLAA